MPLQNCCPAMVHAIEHGYFERLVTYTDKKEPVQIGIGINAYDPIFMLNLCPWCGTEIGNNKGIHREDLPSLRAERDALKAEHDVLKEQLAGTGHALSFGDFPLVP